MKIFKQLTCYNPYLLQLLQHHGSTAESRFHYFSNIYQTKHVNSIVKDMEMYQSLPQFCREKLQSLYDWGCKADNDIPSDIAQLPEFTTSWGAQHHILYYQKCDDGNKFSVLTALLCFNMLLKEIISKLSNGESIPYVPLVHGFIYEDQYFNMVTSTSSIAVHKYPSIAYACWDHSGKTVLRNLMNRNRTIIAEVQEKDDSLTNAIEYKSTASIHDLHHLKSFPIKHGDINIHVH